MDTLSIGLETAESRRRAFEMLVDAYQEAPQAEPESLPDRFEGVLVIEGERTTDGREIMVGALRHRELPLPLLLPNDMGGHGSDAIAGSIDTLERMEVGEKAEWRFGGTFDLNGEDGREAARLVASGMLRFVSMDAEAEEVEFIEEGDCDDEDMVEVEGCEIIMQLLQGRIMGGTLVPFPAFPGAVVVPEGTDIPEATDDGRPAAEPEAASVVAHAAEIVPASHFADPELEAPQRYITLTDDGRVYTHVAIWGECHLNGAYGECVTPEALRGSSGYPHFHVGLVETDAGPISTGPIVLRGGHASTDSGTTIHAARSHYADTESAVADVRLGEDAHGIWASGALRPDATPEQIRALRASGVSGDWRKVGKSFELIAVCSVNTPGFPKVRAHVASGELTALVAAGGHPEPDPALECACEASERLRELEARLERIEAYRDEGIIAVLDERIGADEADEERLAVLDEQVGV